MLCCRVALPPQPGLRLEEPARLVQQTLPRPTSHVPCAHVTFRLVHPAPRVGFLLVGDPPIWPRGGKEHHPAIQALQPRSDGLQLRAGKLRPPSVRGVFVFPRQRNTMQVVHYFGMFAPRCCFLCLVGLFMTLLPDAPWDCHLCRSVGVVPEGSMGRHLFQSHGVYGIYLNIFPTWSIPQT